MSVPSTDGDLPLAEGSLGESVRDLQQRLRAAGHDVDPTETATFGPATRHAVEAFQHRRGLQADGVCDQVTWSVLVESGYRPGDRLLYLRMPMLRGDDIADLQSRLGALGFDAGRVDGIFGPDTERALKDFQRNIGVTVDGVCGPAVLDALARLGRRPTDGTPVALVREIERLRRAPRLLDGRRVVIGETGGLEVLAQATARALRERGALPVMLHHPDGSFQAREANALEADLYLGLVPHREGPCRAAHYATERFVSVGGQRLAVMLSAGLERCAGLEVTQPTGMRLPVLRETRMPAVVCELGPLEVVVQRTVELAELLAETAAAWVEAPLDTD